MLHVLSMMHPHLGSVHSVVIWPAGEGIEQAIREHGESINMMNKHTNESHVMYCIAYHLYLKPGPSAAGIWRAVHS